MRCACRAPSSYGHAGVAAIERRARRAEASAPSTLRGEKEAVRRSRREEPPVTDRRYACARGGDATHARSAARVT